MGGDGLVTPRDGDAGIHPVAVARQGGQHGEGRPLILRLAQHRAVQRHHRVGGDDDVICVGVLRHRPGLAQAQLLHQLGGGGVALHVLVRVRRDDLEALQPHLAQKLPPPGRLGRQNDVHVDDPPEKMLWYCEFLLPRRACSQRLRASGHSTSR